MRKTIAAATVAASIGVGGLVGSVIGVPAVAGAAATATGAAGWVEEALTGLVEDGTIDQAQADAVARALDEARPGRGLGHHGWGRHGHLDVVAEALGISEGELREALAVDQTIAHVAAAEGVDVETVIDAVVEATRERVAERVADGDLTQAEADEVLAAAEERATALVNGELPVFRGGHRHGPWGGRPGR